MCCVDASREGDEWKIGMSLTALKLSSWAMRSGIGRKLDVAMVFWEFIVLGRES